jgi:uncharacterized protein YbbC (DUF1343 family)
VRVKTGLEVVLGDTSAKRKRVGLLCNQASVLADYSHASTALERAGFDVVAYFCPQHGMYGAQQANMIETDHSVDPVSGKPVYSLYADRRTPTDDMLQELDLVYCDLQDVGSRLYTYSSTIILMAQRCHALGKKVVVLDRPNPVDGLTWEGNLLRDDCHSIMGMLPILSRHGLTMGEMLKLASEHYELGNTVEVVRMENWDRSMYFDQTGLPFVFPSPNMPTFNTALAFIGGYLLEGTNLSEGRGTTLPFELIGAPYIDAVEFKRELDELQLPGIATNLSYFEPTFDKHAGEVCAGIQLFVTDRSVARPYLAYVMLIATAMRLYPDDFSWRPPPYEYIDHLMPIDILSGDTEIREMIERAAPMAEFDERFREEAERYRDIVRDCLLYPAPQ